MDEYDKSTKIKHGCWTPNIFFKKNLETNGNIHQRDRETYQNHRPTTTIELQTVAYNNQNISK